MANEIKEVGNQNVNPVEDKNLEDVAGGIVACTDPTCPCKDPENSVRCFLFICKNPNCSKSAECFEICGKYWGFSVQAADYGGGMVPDKDALCPNCSSPGTFEFTYLDPMIIH